MPNPWFESVAEAQRRAKRRLPSSVYGALLAGSEKGITYADNVQAFGEIGLAPHVVGHQSPRDLSTTVMGIPVALPVLISPTGVQAVHPDGEVAVARASANRGTIMGLSSFASKAVEEVTAANANTLFQVYWSGTREAMVQRLDRARSAGAKGLIATLDWSFSHGRDWGSPSIPERMNVKTMVRFAPNVLPHPRWLWSFAKRGQIPDLTAPNLTPPGGQAPTFFEAYYEWMQTPPPTWEDIAWLRDEWGGPFMLKGVGRVDDARRAVDLGVDALSVSNHGGNNLDATPASIRLLPRDRRRGRRPGRSASRRRGPPRERRGEGPRARRSRGHDRARIPVGSRRQWSGRRRERPGHPPQRPRLRRPGPGPRLDQRPRPRRPGHSRGLRADVGCLQRGQVAPRMRRLDTLAWPDVPLHRSSSFRSARQSSTDPTCRSTPTP